jgi:mycothiol synthase
VLSGFESQGAHSPQAEVTLPEGHSARPPSAADAEAMFGVARAGDLADVGRTDWSLADVRSELAQPNGDGLIVCDSDDRIVAWGLVSGIDASVEVHPGVRGRGIGSYLVSEVDRLATGPVIRQEITTANEGARVLLEAAGYRQEQRYWRMELALTGDEEAPNWPPGTSVRPFDRGRDDRPAYDLVSDAMSDIPGDTEQSFEHWSSHALNEGLAPELSTVAGDMAAVALCQRLDGEGYVDYVAVAREWRGRGLGRALLEESFARFAADGLRRAILWVNGRNESATRLYRSVGMEEAFSADRLVKRREPSMAGAPST